MPISDNARRSSVSEHNVSGGRWREDREGASGLSLSQPHSSLFTHQEVKLFTRPHVIAVATRKACDVFYKRPPKHVATTATQARSKAIKSLALCQSAPTTAHLLRIAFITSSMSNHRSVAIPLTAAHAAVPGVIGSQQNNINTDMAPAAPTNGGSQSFAQDHWARYDQLKGVLKSVDNAKNALIEDVLSRYDSVVRQCQNLIDEQNAREIRNKRCNDVAALLNQQAEYITHLQNLMNSNAFIVVVVDGNNFLFKNAFIRDGEKGGRRAAVVFKDEVTEWVSKSVEQPPSDFKILIEVYADFRGLAGTFMSGGVIEKMSTFGEFARGFNTLFEFVDIGDGDVNSRLVGKSCYHVLSCCVHHPCLRANFFQITLSCSFTITTATRSSLAVLLSSWTTTWSMKTRSRDVLRFSKALPQT